MGRGACQGLGRRDIAATGGLLPTAGRPSPTDRRRGDDPGRESTASRPGCSLRSACGCCRLWGGRSRGFVDDPVADWRRTQRHHNQETRCANTGISPHRHRRINWPRLDQRRAGRLGSLAGDCAAPGERVRMSGAWHVPQSRQALSPLSASGFRARRLLFVEHRERARHRRRAGNETSRPTFLQGRCGEALGSARFPKG